ncbi:hydroxypyruvate isomerase [Cnuella takakiae]|uniref:Hydroxypyruvate isomerase n=1 Tax=Cnuella takakiae TaxID=1302690 RepID=A0A1M4XWG8_9BACT|nr:TIM barrel protein [Cnuella takakiae]OLY92967.1 hydroxypyruvate isomerase [Cnuella takakiae]SHE97775.1 hydroxypyruvate isomerase [Cnuella takakiae]
MAHYHRRELIKQLVAGGFAMGALPSLAATLPFSPKNETKLKNNIKHSVCRWTYGFMPLEQLCTTIKEIGFSAIDLVGPGDWATLKKHGIHSSMCNGAEISLTEGWNDPQYHGRLVDNYLKHIDLVADAGYQNLICFSGNRKGMDDATGLKYSSDGLKKIMSKAEKRGVTIIMELLNSKVDHKDYMCDHTAWGVELAKSIGSPNFKLLYDIYHMQIDEGDVIRTIQQSHPYIGHYHTGGVPGRHEIDESQELFYPAIIKSIVATGFKGYLAQEFIPVATDKVASLRKAISICDV